MKKWPIVLIGILIVAGLFLVDGGSVYVKQLINRPPKAAFTYRTPTRTLKYIAPTDRDLILFLNNSTDPDADPLTYTWLVDGQPVSQQKDYSAKLAAGQHQVQLKVSDGKTTVSRQVALTVEADQIYPTKPLNVRYKGMNYAAARTGPEFSSIPTPSRDEMDEQLDTIHNELGCNAIIVQAGDGYEDNLIECSKLALQKGFDRTYAYVRYMNSTLDQTVEKVGRLAARVRSLRETSDSFVWMIGCEFGVSMSGIIPGDTWFDRVRYQLDHKDWWDLVQAKEPEIWRRILPVVKSNYGYPVAYAAATWEIPLVPWSDPSFGEVSPQLYIHDSIGQTESWALNQLSSLKRFGKPVIVSEFGCNTYTGAGTLAGAPLFMKQNPYDEDEQANYIEKYCNMLNKANINGAFLYMYNDDLDKSLGLYNGTRRKKGFYMYKSYVVTNSSSATMSEFEVNLKIPTMPLAPFGSLTRENMRVTSLQNSKDKMKQWLLYS